MNLRKIALVFALLLGSHFAQAQAAEYLFCVQSENYETFKARVVFRGLDFGKNSAEQMVRNDLEAVLEGDFQISLFASDCPCENCPQMEVTSKDWDGNFSENDGSLNNIWGSAVEISDAVVSEGKALWDNPGEFLMTRLLGSKKKNDGA